MRKLRLKNLKCENFVLQTFEPDVVYISNVVFDEGFEILQKVGDIVKLGQPILQKNGQNVLSSVYGIVKNIKLEKNVNNELVYYIEIEKIHSKNNMFFNEKNDENCLKNDLKNDENLLNEEWIFEKPQLKNKSDLIDLCKKFGLCSKQNFTYKIVEKMGENLIVDAFDEKLVFNNKILLENSADIIKTTVEDLAQILCVKKVIFYCNKNLKHLVLKLCNGLNLQAKIVIKTKQTNCGITLEDLVNIFNAKRQKGQTKNLVSVCGGAINKNCVLNISYGTKISDIIAFCGGFKQNIDEIEDFKYMALVAFNDEQILKQKIKNAKILDDRHKLEDMLKEKQHEAYENIFSKLEIYHKKYLECLSAVFISQDKSKILTKNFELPLSMNFQGLSFLSFDEFN